jgi:hypothetical protein
LKIKRSMEMKSLESGFEQSRYLLEWSLSLRLQGLQREYHTCKEWHRERVFWGFSGGE